MTILTIYLEISLTYLSNHVSIAIVRYNLFFISYQEIYIEVAFYMIRVQFIISKHNINPIRI